MKNYFNKLIYRIPLWCYLLLIGIATFSTYQIVIVHDMGLYLSYALNLYNGHGYVDMAGNAVSFRSFAFPAMLTASFFLMDASPWSAFWVVRLFCILNPIMIFFVTRKLHNERVGFISALLVLGSYTMNDLAYKHLDVVWPFFIFLMVFLIIHGFEKKSKFLFFLAAVSLGCGYLVKEISVLFFPYVILIFLFVKEFRTKSHIKYVFIFYTTLILSVIPWLLYKVFIIRLSVLSVFIDLYNKQWELIKWGGNDSLIDTLLQYIQGFYRFFHGQHNSLSENFLFHPLLILGWLIIFWRAKQRDKSSMMYLSFFICFLPAMIFMGISHYRIGQGLIFYYVSYTLVALMIYNIALLSANYIHKNFPNTKMVGINILLVLLVITALYIQYDIPYGNDKGNKKFLRYSVLKHPDRPHKVKKTFNTEHQAAGNWMVSNIEPGARCIIPKRAEGFGFYFYSKGQYPIYQMPLKILSTRKKTEKNKIIEGNIVFITSALKYDDPRNIIYVLFEDNLMEYLQKNSIEYVLISKYRNYLKLYFDKNPGSFEKVKDFKGGTAIYRVKHYKPLDDFNTLVSSKMVHFLNDVHEKKKDTFINHDSVINLKNYFGLKNQDIEKILNEESTSRFKIVKYKKIY